MNLPLLTAALGVAIYLLAPGPSQSLLGSWPLTPAGVIALVTAIGSVWLARAVTRGGVQLGSGGTVWRADRGPIGSRCR